MNDHTLKALTNENKGGLTVETFDRSTFKLFSLRFSNKSLQAPTWERTVSVICNQELFPNNGIVSGSDIQYLSHHTLNLNNGIVYPYCVRARSPCLMTLVLF
jgi:hypothetical protein